MLRAYSFGELYRLRDTVFPLHPISKLARQDLLIFVLHSRIRVASCAARRARRWVRADGVWRARRCVSARRGQSWLARRMPCSRSSGQECPTRRSSSQRACPTCARPTSVPHTRALAPCAHFGISAPRRTPLSRCAFARRLAIASKYGVHLTGSAPPSQAQPEVTTTEAEDELAFGVRRFTKPPSHYVASTPVHSTRTRPWRWQVAAQDGRDAATLVAPSSPDSSPSFLSNSQREGYEVFAVGRSTTVSA